jgi:hypothetical protein
VLLLLLLLLLLTASEVGCSYILDQFYRKPFLADFWKLVAVLGHQKNAEAWRRGLCLAVFQR